MLAPDGGHGGEAGHDEVAVGFGFVAVFGAAAEYLQQRGGQGFVGNAAPEDIAGIEHIIAVEAGLQTTLGGDADAVAGAAESAGVSSNNTQRAGMTRDGE